MCRFVGVIVFQGVIEDIRAFDSRVEAIGWIAEKTREYGSENCSDSLLWDLRRQTRIDLAFIMPQ